MPRESTAFSRPQQPDFVLAPIVGAEPISRAEITKRVWSYIKANGAQNSLDRPQIHATTPQLRALFDGASSCTMFELTKYVDSHLLSAESSVNTSQQDRNRRQKVRLIREEKRPR
jgi:chromatin remodeling complex protein RSC6